MSGAIKQEGLFDNEEVEKKAYEELIAEYKEKINVVNNEINRLNINYVKENIKKEMNLKVDEEIIKKTFSDLNKFKSQRGEYYATLKKLEVAYNIK